jgi:hypothetical protein
LGTKENLYVFSDAYTQYKENVDAHSIVHRQAVRRDDTYT